MAAFKLGRFVGVKTHNVDDKGRLTIPSAWRPETGSDENQFLAIPTNGHVTVYPPKMIAQLEEKISQISIGDVEAQEEITEFMSMAHAFSCDKSGRINLNDELLDYAQIQKGAVLIGKLNSFSIYSEEVYDATKAKRPSDPAKQAAIFKRLGL